VLGQADERVGAELLVLVGLGWDEGEVLGRDDLVGVDVLLFEFFFLEGVEVECFRPPRT
jgi:hypothetical protein